MKKMLTVLALATGFNSFSLPALPEQDEAMQTRQPIKMTDQELGEVTTGEWVKLVVDTRNTRRKRMDVDIDPSGHLGRRDFKKEPPDTDFKSSPGTRDHEFNIRSYRVLAPAAASPVVGSIVQKLTVTLGTNGLIESGVILTQTPVDLDNYQTPPKDPCDWAWVNCRSACEQKWWVYCREGQ
jgi:hypothetical protein